MTDKKQEQCTIPVVTRSFDGWTRFNMNHYCLVQPNERGKEQFIKSWTLTMTQKEAEDFYYFTLNAAPAESIHWMTDAEIIQYKVTKP